MAKSRKPTVTLNCVASKYAGPNERIIEVSSEVGGCLVALRVVNGVLRISPYRLDEQVEVVHVAPQVADHE